MSIFKAIKSNKEINEQVKALFRELEGIQWEFFHSIYDGIDMNDTDDLWKLALRMLRVRDALKCLRDALKS